MNETTRMFPRTLADAFPDNVEAIKKREISNWYEHYEKSYDGWLNILYSFLAGCITSMLVFIK